MRLRHVENVPPQLSGQSLSNRGFNRLHGPEVPIITSPFLPKTKTVDSGPLQDRETFQERTPDRFQEFLDASGKRCFQRFQEQVRAEVVGHRLNEDVNVLRHEDRGDQPARLTEDGLIEAYRQEISSAAHGRRG